MKRLLITAVVVIIVAGTAVGGYLRARKTVQPEVSTMAVSRGDIVQVVGATGTLEAVTTVDVGTQVTGVIKEMYTDFNRIVAKGQLIAKIDPATIEAQLAQDDAQLQNAEASLERLNVTLLDATSRLKRAHDLFKRNLITQQDLETAQVNVRTTEAQIKAQRAGITQIGATRHQHEVNLEYTNIYAPIDGIVINRKVDVGQTVVSNNMATSMFQIAQDLTKMQLKASIDESDVGMLRPGQAVTFRVDAYASKEFTGSVAQVRLQPIVTQNVVTYTTIIAVPNPDLELKPGMTANVTIQIARRPNVMRVPLGALRFRATSEIFLALGLPEPPDLRQRSRGIGAGTSANVALASDAGPAEGIASRGATTIDALFGELRFEPVDGRVWVYVTDGADKKLTSMNVKTGLTDGTYAELIEGANLGEGTLLVTNVDLGRPTAVRPGANPLMPGRQMMGGDHGGGHGPH